MNETSQLGEATAPESIGTTLGGQVEEVYDMSFIKTYQSVGRLTAVLAWLSALIALLMVEGKKVRTDSG